MFIVVRIIWSIKNPRPFFLGVREFKKFPGADFKMSRLSEIEAQYEHDLKGYQSGIDHVFLVLLVAMIIFACCLKFLPLAQRFLIIEVIFIIDLV
eukprot:UN26830